MENQALNKELENMENIESLINETEEKVLKGNYRRRQEKNCKNTEPVWINDTIRKEINEKKSLIG